MPARSAGVCCAGSAATGATFPGGAPAIRIASWSPSSCCSRPRSYGWRGTTTAFWHAIPPWKIWHQPHRPWCGRAGRGWATIGERSTCTGWRRKWSRTEQASFPRKPRSSAGYRASEGTPPRRWRALRSSERSPPSIPTWAGCSAGCSIPEPDPGLWLDGSNGRRKCSCPEAAGKPGCSIRQSWSWVRWSVPHGYPNAGSVRCGPSVRLLFGKPGGLPQHRAGKERNQAESPRNRGDNPLAGSQFVEVAGRFTGRIQPSQPGRSG